MKDIKKNVTIKSKVKLKNNKETPFEIDLNYSEEYDSFNIKVKKDVGFMSYTDSLQGLPLEVVQKLNEMLEEVLVKAGSKTEMMEDLEVELGAEPNPDNSYKSHSGSVKIKTHKVKVKSLTEAQNKVREFIEKNDLGAGNFTGGDLFSHGKKIGRVSYNGRVWNLKDEPMKMADGGDFQAGVYNRGGAMKNERLHVNKDEDYEVRYSKPRPHRKGYKGLRNFDEGGEMDLTDDKRLRVRKPVMPERKMSEQEWAEKHNPRAYEYMTKRKMATGGGVEGKDTWQNIFEEYGFKKGRSKYGLDMYYKRGYTASVDKNLRNVDLIFEDDVLYKGYSIQSLLDVLDNQFGKRKMATGGGVGLVGNQSRIDMNKNGKIDAEDFKLLRSSMNGAWRNERKHVNHNEDYEVRYAKPRLSRTGYKGKRKFEGGGGVSKFKMLSDKVARNYEGKRVKPQYQKEYGKVYSKSEAKEVGDKVAGKVKAMQKAESGTMIKKGAKGGIMVLAKKIRKEGESWQDAVKRAGQQLK
jgi:hypothetical protein